MRIKNIKKPKKSKYTLDQIERYFCCCYKHNNEHDEKYCGYKESDYVIDGIMFIEYLSAKDQKKYFNLVRKVGDSKNFKKDIVKQIRYIIEKGEMASIDFEVKRLMEDFPTIELSIKCVDNIIKSFEYVDDNNELDFWKSVLSELNKIK